MRAYEAQLVDLCHKGKAYRDRAGRLRLNPRYAAAPTTREPIIILIAKRDVPEFYELGWRFIYFNGDHCAFEWRSSREPRYGRWWLEMDAA